jgi:hypothetical protein
MGTSRYKSSFLKLAGFCGAFNKCARKKVSGRWLRINSVHTVKESTRNSVGSVGKCVILTSRRNLMKNGHSDPDWKNARGAT